MDRLGDIQAFWNNSVSEYDAHMRESGHYDAQAKLFRKLNSYFSSPVLDLAAGPGFLAELMLAEGLEVTANDFSEGMASCMIKRLSSRFSHVEFTQWDAARLPEGGVYGTIVCCNLLYYLDEHRKSIALWRQRLRDDGRIILFEEYPFHRPESDTMEEQSARLMNIVEPLCPDDIRDIFVSTGFRIENEAKAKIDESHDLFGFVFASKQENV